MALQKKDVWADRWFWAPEVYEVNGKFYMYYSADEHICVATADSPAGPFTQSKKEPMIADEKCIATLCLLMMTARLISSSTVSTTGSTSGWPNWRKTSWLSRRRPCTLASTSLRLGGGMAPCEWRPFVIKRNGLYYMTYSANSYESPFYGIGCATATDLMGTWTKYEENPLLQKPGELLGWGTVPPSQTRQASFV